MIKTFLLFAFLLPLIAASFSSWGADNKVFMGTLVSELRDFKEGVEVNINRPKGSYKKLLEWKEKEIYYCLIFKIPLNDNEEKGRLTFGERSNIGCSLEDVSEDQVIGKGIDSLKVKKVNSSGLTYQLLLNKSKKLEVLNYRFPLGGGVNDKERTWSLIELRNSEEKVNPNYLGVGNFCHLEDSKCAPPLSESCSTCRGNIWTPVFNRRCADRLSAVCGPYQCGNREQPACLRMLSLKVDISCEESLSFVYCHYGLEAFCRPSGVTYCR